MVNSHHIDSSATFVQHNSGYKFFKAVTHVYWVTLQSRESSAHL